MSQLRPEGLTIHIHLATDHSQLAPEGPGWYIHSNRPLTRISEDDPAFEEVVPRVRLKNDEMLKIAKVLDNFIKGKPLNWTEHSAVVRGESNLEDAVELATDSGRQILQEKLAEAEVAVRRLNELRARAEEFGA